MKWLYALIIVIVVGCAGHSRNYKYIEASPYAGSAKREYKVWVDKNFGEADRVEIDKAVQQWNYALNQYVKLEIVSYGFDMEEDIIRAAMRGDGWIVMKIMSSNPIARVHDKPARAGEKQYYTLAYVDRIGGYKMYVIRDRISNEWINGIMLHEIGHLLGSGHESEYLMAPRFSWESYRCVDYESMRHVAIYQKLDMNRLNYCVYVDP